jgi:hypothetical protein
MDFLGSRTLARFIYFLDRQSERGFAPVPLPCAGCVADRWICKGAGGMPIKLHRVSAAMRAAGRLSALVGLLTLLGGSLPGIERPLAGLDLAWETLPAQDEEGRPLGALVWSALTDPATASPARPVMVVFNGGPGAASGWLQLGLLGPLQVSLPPQSGADMPAVPPLRIAERAWRRRPTCCLSIRWIPVSAAVILPWRPIACAPARPMAPISRGLWQRGWCDTVGRAVR